MDVDVDANNLLDSIVILLLIMVVLLDMEMDNVPIVMELVTLMLDTIKELSVEQLEMLV